MPTYEYKCEACGNEFEQFQPITARVLRKCPACDELKLRRLIGIGAGIIFKGSGFYQTDYRSDSYKKAAEADKPKTEADKSKVKAAEAGEKAKTTAEPKTKTHKKADGSGD